MNLRSAADPSVLVVGAGIGGLTTALELQRVGIRCRIVEAVERFGPVGVGINVLPHASRLLGELGLEEALSTRAVLTRESVFFNRFGQLIHREPAGRGAGYADPQYSIHRADLHGVLLNAVTDRLGKDAFQLGSRVVAVKDDGRQATAHVKCEDGSNVDIEADVIVAADGINSAVREQLFPGEGPPRYSGVTMWRGVSVWPSFLSGASMVRAGWLAGGKLVIYPIREHMDGQGKQLVNWVAEIETPQRSRRDWDQRGQLEDFLPSFSDWHFDWLDVPEMLKATEMVLKYPMVDHDPLPRWSHGRLSLLGDAAHPMVPRGSNGAGQCILDAHALAECLAADRSDPVAALAAYDDVRREATAAVVLMNRSSPPDAILREVYERTRDRPFDRLEDVITSAELEGITESYKQVSGSALSTLGVVTTTATSATDVTDDLRSLYEEFDRANLLPLWTQREDLMPVSPQPQAKVHRWRWSELYPIAERAGKLVPVGRGGERRAIALANPGLAGRPYATPTLWAAIQYLGPGEKAPAHRHSQTAFRFVLEGEGVWTNVAGDPVAMRRGDLLLTPSWDDHEHHNVTDGPMAWLDGLDIPLVSQLDAGFFEFGAEQLTTTATPTRSRSERLWGYPGLRPGAGDTSEQSPLKVYRWEHTDACLREQLEIEAEGYPSTCEPGHALIRFVHPGTGRDALRTIRTEMHRVAAGASMRPRRAVGSSVCLVFQGAATAKIGEESYELETGDVFVIPSWAPMSLFAETTTDLFCFSDAPVYEALSLARTEIEVEGTSA